MARQVKVLPARRPRDEDDSILLRSAETIGRVIGTLQRQLDGARGRFSEFVLDKEIGSNDGNGSRPKKAARKNGATKVSKPARTAKRASRRKTSTAATAAKTRSAGAAKSTSARRRAKR